MQAIILAAGMGRRLKKLTQNNTKCMVKVNGVSLVDRLLHQLEHQSLSRIVIVVGYEGKKLMDYIETLGIQTPIEFIDNPVYDKTNNIYSLALAKDWLLREDTLLFESDLIVEDGVIEMLKNDPRDTLALVDKYESWMDGTCVQLSEDDSIVNFVPGKRFNFADKDSYYKTVNIYKFGKEFSRSRYVPFLDAYSSALGNNEYYEQVLRVIAMLDDPGIKALRLSGQKWYEIDDVQDLDIAESLFAPDDETQLKLLQSRYGGYWRYPKLKDFCYLVNPYFPPKKMKDEIRSSFDDLLSQYPSGMRVNSLIAARNYNVDASQIVVGNGAAELIKSLMGVLRGSVGIVRPTFEEYPNRYEKTQEVVFSPDNEAFSYTAADLMTFFGEHPTDNLVLINPDNPSGNYLGKEELERLIDWTAKKNMKLVVDESFSDFADEPVTLMDEEFLAAHPHVYVMKSISKSYGVPGLRLGVLASGDTETIAFMKKDVAIWNINSFAEFYLQIWEKYEKDYTKALERFRAERARFAARLKEIPGLTVYPSQANYVLAKLDGKLSAGALTRRLLIEYNLLIKDLTSKAGGPYIRLAVRNEEDNDRLVEALREVL
ncbi:MULTISPECIES: aminotransferase class I/II-fold pyridoxal phosphate-dependent enzyme [unclassified Candidatus Paralachnospira]|uniref:aminotransferase class I/II-fold pyridoxal phosphate-dependent enzyme n=1 Tax=unclassified Candidatus Paralachnospira TaxID=3099471 RepID=UPI003F9281E1